MDEINVLCVYDPEEKCYSLIIGTEHLMLDSINFVRVLDYLQMVHSSVIAHEKNEKERGG